MLDNAIQGTDLKFRVEIDCSGFDLSEDELEIAILARKKEIPVPHLDSLSGDDLSGKAAWLCDPDAVNTIYVCIPTRGLPQTVLWLLVKAHVPDPDFPSGERVEIATLQLCTLTTQHP